MDYKRFLSPISSDKNLEVVPEVIKQKIYDLEKEFNIKLPSAYIEMVMSCDGGRIENTYALFKNDKGKTCRTYIDIMYGVNRDFWNIQRAYKQNWELLLDNGFYEFVYDLMFYIFKSGQFDKFREEGIIPEYFDSEEPDDEQINQFYQEFHHYVEKLDAIISKIEYTDNRSLNAQVVGYYEMVKFFRLSFEFASDDGHGAYYFFYGDKNNSEPSVWYAYDLDYWYKISPNFEEFIKSLVVNRKDLCFGVDKIDDNVCSFINKLLTCVFGFDSALTIEILLDSIANKLFGYEITLYDKYAISVSRNMYRDGSGYIENFYRNYEFIIEVGVKCYDDSDQMLFKEEFEDKIISVFNDFKNIKLLYKVGYHGMIEEIMKADE